MSEFFGDMFKDAYGFRPGADYGARIAAMTDAELAAEGERLQAAVDRSIEEDRQEGILAKHQFDAIIAKAIAAGAGSRQNALRWLVQANDSPVEFYDDVEYFLYHHGLSHDTALIKEILEAINVNR